MVNVIKALIVISSISSISVHAQSNKLKQKAVGPKQKLSHLVQKAYEDTMSAYFLGLYNLSKKSKTASEFLSAYLDVTPGSDAAKRIEAKFANAPAPQVFTISKGVEVSFGNSKFTMTLGNKFGELLVDGKPAANPDPTILKELLGEDIKTSSINQNFLLKLFLPEANAVVAGILVRILKEAVVEGAKMAAKAAAVGVGAGAVGGCSLSVYFKSETDQWPEACMKGLFVGGALGAGFGSVSLFGAGVFVNVVNPDLSKQEVDLLSKRFKQLAKVTGAAGAIITVGFLGKKLLESEGVKVKCTYDGSYSIIPVHLGGTEDPAVMSSSDGKLTILGEVVGGAAADIKASLVKKGLSDDQATLLAKNLMEEHQTRIAQCKKTPHKDQNVIFSDAKQLGEIRKKEAGESKNKETQP